MNSNYALVSTLLWSATFLFISAVSTSAQQDCDLKFNGDWTYDKDFDAFKGFTTKHGNTDRDSIYGLVTFSIADELNNNPDPSPEQLATYQFICENQAFIRSVLLDSSKVYFTDYFEMLEGEEWVTKKEKDAIEKMDLIQLMSPQRLHILEEHKDGYAYFGVGGHCIWELDEGFGFLLHKKRVITADVIFVSHETGPAKEDNGTYAKPEIITQLGEKIPPMPMLYLPHPKYGKLKPTEEQKNIRYVYDLVKQGYIEEVIKLYEEDKIVLQRPEYDLVKTAVRYNQLNLLKYFLDHEPDNSTGLIQDAARNKNKEMVQWLLEKGHDINEIITVSPIDCIKRRHIDNIDTRFPISDDEFTAWMKSLGAKTSQEIVHEYIATENAEKLKSIFKNNHSLQKDKFIRFALEDDKPKMAKLIFSTYREDDFFLLNKAANFESTTLMSFCLNQGYDINTNLSWNKMEPKTVLNKVQERKERKSGKDFENILSFEKWLIKNGALTSEQIKSDSNK